MSDWPRAIAGTGGVVPSVNDFRLTLSSGNPVYTPIVATPTSTGTNTITFSTDPAYTTGTIVGITTAAGGASNLVVQTQYWLGNLGGGVYAFYTSLANAIADTSRIVLSSGTTPALLPTGIESQTLYLSPYKGNSIGLYNGGWTVRMGAEVSLALGTLTNALPYDVWAFWSGSAITLELLAWTNATTRATGLSRQDGTLVKSGDSTRRYVGTLYTRSTTTCMDDGGGLQSQVGGKRFLYNMEHRVRARIMYNDQNFTWTYGSATVRQANAQSTAKVEFVQGLGDDDIEVALVAGVVVSNSAQIGIGIDSVTTFQPDSTFHQLGDSSGGPVCPTTARWNGKLLPGYHYASWLESDSGASGATFVGWNASGVQSKSGLLAEVSI